MKGKNLTAFGKLLSKYGDDFKDNALITEMYSGFSLVILEEFKHAFDYEPILPTSATDMLQSNSALNNASLSKRTKSSGDIAVDNKLWDMAIEERHHGWLIGPYYSVDLSLNHLSIYAMAGSTNCGSWMLTTWLLY